MTASLSAPAALAASNDRLGFALCLALAVHALVIFGIGFTVPKPVRQPPQLEVTLAKYREDQAPRQADFIARHHQQGSGTLDEAANLASPHSSPQDDTGIQASLTLPTSPPVDEADPAPEQDQVTSARSARKLSEQQLIDMIRERPVEEQIAILERSLEIASLEARFSLQRQNQAKKPRVRRLTSVSAQAAADAEYLLYWQGRIERIGNLNYPAISRQRRLYGSLLLQVSIRSDGKLLEARVLESSGHALLDDAALRIARMAAPYAPFPADLAQNADVLEIIRTWHFRRDQLTAE